MGFDYKKFIEELYIKDFIRTKYEKESLLDCPSVGALINLCVRMLDKFNNLASDLKKRDDLLREILATIEDCGSVTIVELKIKKMLKNNGALNDKTS